MRISGRRQVAAFWFAALVLFIVAIGPLLILSLHADGLAILIQLFVGDSVDAPDNWAMAFQRSGYFFVLFASCSAICATLGLWQNRKRA